MKLDKVITQILGLRLFLVFPPQVGADGECHIRVGKLNMVDLAGSERQAKTGAAVSISYVNLGEILSKTYPHFI